MGERVGQAGVELHYSLPLTRRGRTLALLAVPSPKFASRIWSFARRKVHWTFRFSRFDPQGEAGSRVGEAVDALGLLEGHLHQAAPRRTARRFEQIAGRAIFPQLARLDHRDAVGEQYRFHHV